MHNPPAGSTSAAIISKTEFAKLCNVAPSRVSHWIADGRISGKAIVGTGRSARIAVAVAQRQIRSNLDPGQMMSTGNGAATRLASPARPRQRTELPPEAAKLMSILSGLPSLAAWETAVGGGTAQRAFDIFSNMRLDIIAEMRLRGFVVDERDFEPVDWRGLADEFGIEFTSPRTMAADWQRRRDED